LDRAALGARVFADSEERRALEEITHPHILRLLHDQIDAALREQPDAVVVVETPLLYEAGMRPWFDMVVVVAASEETQIARLCVCRGMTRDGALARIRAQMPLADKIADADYTLWNDGDAEAIEPRVGEALRMLTARVAERGPRSRRGKKGACTITGRVL
jgi:dephospho-CoA kinase